MTPDLTVADAAALLKLNGETVRQLCARGLLRGAYKSGRGGRTSPWRIPAAALDKYRALQPHGYRG